MSRFQRVLAVRWRSMFLVCVLIALSGVAVILWARIDAGDRRADELRAESDRRGDAVSTLAQDVRALRAQVEAGGGTPAAPDPSDAVDDLLDRVRVPTAAHGLPGAKGERGATGAGGAAGAGGKPGPGGARGESGSRGEPGPPGPSGSPGPSGQPGEQGPPGTDGANGTNGNNGADGAGGPAGPPGPDGAQGYQGTRGDTGPRGEKGEKGEKGEPGPACPAGYSLQAPANDPDALICRRAAAQDPPADPSGILLLPPLLLRHSRRTVRS
ncbi:collagen-like protein [Streptomyces sp. NPDC060205]|uniref:collagen-like protein n=1 Tax=Streptomyces sp. NPDC060205 TaxID=3347072 RepID=UPI003648AB81